MVSVEEKQRISSLLDIYGGLLTDRQSDFMDLYYNEDLSYGEIANAEDISRQAVHDTISHAIKSLEKFESHLGLLRQLPNGSISQPSNEPDMGALRTEIAELSRFANENDLLYDTSVLRRKVKRLRELAGMD